MNDYCQSCSQYKITETVHERCMDHECVCECRGPRLDLSNVRTRLLVAQTLQTVADSDFLSEENPSPEVLYVNGLIKDFAREKMQGLFGLVSDTKQQLDSNEVLLVRERLNNEYVLYSDFEDALTKFQSMFENAIKTITNSKIVPAPRLQGSSPSEIVQETTVTPPTKNIQRMMRAPTSKPMPSRGAFLGVTQEQSLRTVEMNQKRQITDQSLNDLSTNTGE